MLFVCLELAECLPGLSADVKVFQGDVQAFFESFSLSSDCALALTESSSIVWHARVMACPSQLALAHDDNDAGNSSHEPLRNL